jgi:hypothetical protein
MQLEKIFSAIGRDKLIHNHPNFSLPLPKLLKYGITLILGVGVSASVVQNANATDYAVNISGTVLQRPFYRSGLVRIVPTITTTTQNGVNPVDVLLASGNPGANPQTGAIQFMTNNAFIGSPSRLDLAYVSYFPQYALLRSQPDSRIAAVGANIFNALSGITAQAYQIYDGYMDIQYLNGGQNISGVIDVVGRGLTFSSQNRYTARFSGSLLSASNSSKTLISKYSHKPMRVKINSGAKPKTVPVSYIFGLKGNT